MVYISLTQDPLGTAPVERNLKAPLPGSDSPEQHPCWPWRVVSHFHQWLEFGQAIQPDTCILDCHASIETEDEDSPLADHDHGPVIVNLRQEDDDEVCIFVLEVFDAF